MAPLSALIVQPGGELDVEDGEGRLVLQALDRGCPRGDRHAEVRRVPRDARGGGPEQGEEEGGEEGGGAGSATTGRACAVHGGGEGRPGGAAAG
eukprot:CAMPEP_0173449844 /NCGR_PEP_ID=MMETSP1357-20121228/43506_1 /TAXON_ID=77926 /ORGANISM="Hemiselmis rufescens, Strain PCC563" /LENGTH=93 /DNA_ID=CAMNT_0014416459 /DNA_START=106 /DNA_END=383 /DNA_ORIENTATION=-